MKKPPAGRTIPPYYLDPAGDIRPDNQSSLQKLPVSGKAIYLR
jgi:hypothetical protein